MDAAVDFVPLRPSSLHYDCPSGTCLRYARLSIRFAYSCFVFQVARAAFKNVLRDFHRLCGRIGLFGKELEAIDGSFFKALNGKAGNFTETKLNRMEARIEIVQAGNDSRQLESMAKAAGEALEIEPSEERPVDFIADGGYYNSAQVARCEAAGMRMHVPAGKNSVEREEGYRDEDFVHDAQSDESICPQEMRLRRHAAATRKEIVYRIYYDTAVCRGCPCLQRCTGGSYRKVALRMEQTPEVYARRKGLAEHPFGTMKSVWGYGQFMVMGRTGCEGEMNLMALCYNWKRAIAAVGLKALMEALVGLFRVPRGWFSGLCEPNNLRTVVVHA